MSKILYFFEVEIDNNPCLIFDTQILLSLQKNNIDEFKNVDWEQADEKEEKYFEYLRIVNTISKEKLKNSKIEPEAIELFLFHYNMHFKLEKKWTKPGRYGGGAWAPVRRGSGRPRSGLETGEDFPLLYNK